MAKQKNSAVHCDSNKESIASSTNVGKLLYTVREEHCDWLGGKTHRVQLKFYEHMVVARRKEMLPFDCLPEKYCSEAFPRFKIMNVTFTNGSRNRWRWSVFFLLLTVLVLSILLPNSETKGDVAIVCVFSALVFLCVIALIFLCKQHRYVTFDLRTHGSSCHSCTKSFEFRKERLDEDFMLDYVFGSLRHGYEATHKVSHFNWASLASPMKVELSGAIVDSMMPERNMLAEP